MLKVDQHRGIIDPAVQYDCTFKNGDIQDLTGATVEWVYYASADGITADEGAARIVRPMTVVDATGGVATFPWTTADVDTVAKFVAQVFVTANGRSTIFPAPGEWISVEIHESAAP